VLGLMGSDFKKTYGPYAPGLHNLPFPDTTKPGIKTADYLEMARTQLKNNVTSGLAAIIIEPVQGTAGNIEPPRDFLIGLKEIAKEFDALFIADEMITGFGRTGHFWGTEISGVIPDIITLGKQFGGGYPISGVLTTSEISNTKPWGAPSGSSSSYGGNPLAAAAALSAISIIEEENLVENSKQMGEYFLQHLKDFEQRYPFLTNARGVGMMLGIDLVDPKSKKLLDKSTCKQFFDKFMQRGLLTMSYSPRFRIQPAMIIDKNTIDNIVQIMDDTFKEIKL
jgi:4-aminobutyrate aminotransferase-like enzyme